MYSIWFPSKSHKIPIIQWKAFDWPSFKNNWLKLIHSNSGVINQNYSIHLKTNWIQMYRCESFLSSRKHLKTTKQFSTIVATELMLKTIFIESCTRMRPKEWKTLIQLQCFFLMFISTSTLQNAQMDRFIY